MPNTISMASEEMHPSEPVRKRVVVAICFEIIRSNYFVHLVTTLTSLLDSNRRNQLRIYLVSLNLTDDQRIELQDLVTRHGQDVVFISQLTKAQHALVDRMFAKNELAPRAVYYRLLLPQLLPSEPRVLYIDSGDVIVAKDLLELYTRSFEGCVLSGVPDAWSEEIQLKYRNDGEQAPDLYVNSGVLLINLSALRACGWPNELEAMLEAVDYFPYHDQCMMNQLFAGRILELPSTYNQQIVYDGAHKLSRSSHVYHYASSVHELYPLFNVKYFYKLYYSHVDKTRFAGFRPPQPTTVARVLRTVPRMFYLKKFIKRVLSGLGLLSRPRTRMQVPT